MPDKADPLAKFTGTYEFETPDFGITIYVDLTEEDTLRIQATDQTAATLQHIEDNRYDFDSPNFGTIWIEFFEGDDGNVVSMGLESYEWGFEAIKVSIP